jgi:hypothetical protein
MRDLTPRELELVAAFRKTPKPILDLPDAPIPISEEIENWIILLPSNVRDGLIKTIGRMLGTVAKMTPMDLRIMGELRDSQNTYFVQKADYLQREVNDVNTVLAYIQVGYTSGGGLLNSITPPLAGTCVSLLKYALDSPQHGYEWMEYEARFNDYFIETKQENDLVDSDAKTLKAWLKVLGEYSGVGGTTVPTQLMTTAPIPPSSAADKSPEFVKPANAKFTEGPPGPFPIPVSAVVKAYGSSLEPKISKAWPVVVAELKKFGIDSYFTEVGIAAIIMTESQWTPMKEKHANPSKQPDLYKVQERYWNTGYMGRGYIQLTWEKGYRAAGSAIGMDLVKNPDLLLQIEVSAKVAAWFFKERSCNKYADQQIWAGSSKSVRGLVGGGDGIDTRDGGKTWGVRDFLQNVYRLLNTSR